MAAEGPIVVINTTEFRSDAIIVTSSIKSLTLPKLIFPEAEDRMGCLVRGKLSTFSSGNKELEKLLRWLWDVAVEHVFQELQFGAVKNS